MAAAAVYHVAAGLGSSLLGGCGSLMRDATCLVIAGYHGVSWHDGSGVMRKVHGSYAGRRAGFEGEGEWRDGFAELLECPRGLATLHLPRHRRRACPQNLLVLYAHEEDQTGNPPLISIFREVSNVSYPHIDSDLEHHACHMRSTRIVSCCGQR